ncbi:MAG TPA: GatB/YqeY domain-containing protein [Longimicrobiales bacterium]|nr:GatB/YqeY domain-containing protein [Longimicrobiales bacterium]
MAGSLKDRLREDLNVARRARDKARTLVLTTTLSEVRNREIELGRDAEDEDVQQVVQRAVKRRREAAEQMRAGNREDLALREDQEAELLAKYLPAQLSEDEVRELVRAAIAGGADNVGAVMGRIMPSIKGVFDGREANRIVREELG